MPVSSITGHFAGMHPAPGGMLATKCWYRADDYLPLTAQLAEARREAADARAACEALSGRLARLESDLAQELAEAKAAAPSDAA